MDALTATKLLKMFEEFREEDSPYRMYDVIVRGMQDLTYTETEEAAMDKLRVLAETAPVY